MKASNRLHARLMCAASALALSLGTAAHAEVRQFDIPAGSLGEALAAFGMQSDLTVVTTSDITRSKSSKEVTLAAEPEIALAQLLGGTGLTFRREGDTFLIVRADSPQGGSAAGAGAEVEALIVTAQKREEDIQDVPIAMSAFTQEALDAHQISGGPDLMTQIPNFTFTKTNFSGYSIQIRGIGTQAISATVDPAVAVAFNNTTFVTNRFFEQEFYDLQRVEVLRGPQGTLYGRNATAGVVNIISAKPTFNYEVKIAADVGNYSSRRLEGMINIPLVDDRVALRLAGAWTKRDGFVTNTLKGEQTDGRDLWSGRLTLGFEPTDDLRAWLTFEHFEEDDDRLRSGKQLCTRHDFPAVMAPIIDTSGGGAYSDLTRYSQGCQMGSLYEAEAFQVPNGYALPFFGPLASLGLPIDSNADPYANATQSRDMRVIETHLDPIYKAKSDILHLSVEYDLSDDLTLSSETAYGMDELFSFNDYNRFSTAPGIFDPDRGYSRELTYQDVGLLDENGVFCDPQLGCSDRLVAADVSTARSHQFSQEFRLSSNFDGPFNFHVGANYLNYSTINKYYVFFNTLSLFGVSWCNSNVDPLTAAEPYDPGDTSLTCLRSMAVANPVSPTVPRGFTGIYVDRNPIGSLDDYGRNYFLSKNPFRLVSYAVFGEAQYELTPDLKITAGLRMTVDEKEAPDIPTWLLVSMTYGLPTRGVVSQKWEEPTGRLVIDWRPAISFTDETLFYVSYAHGYKAGGANPPLPGSLPFDGGGRSQNLGFILSTQPREFDPEFVDAFELGSKNALFDGAFTLNAAAFYYDYQGYQISQIANRSAVNWNIDAEVWGAEFEVDWHATENLRFGFRGGYEKTKVGEDQALIDMIDRTAGDPGWFVLKPFPTVPSNCIAPVDLFLEYGRFFSCDAYYSPDRDPVTNLPYEPNPTQQLTMGDFPAIVPLGSEFAGYPGFRPGDAPGGGAGVAKDLGGNELPNAPDTTMTFTVDYAIPLPNNWLLTLHGDYYRQSEAWARIFNEDPYDKLRSYSTINVAAIFTNEDAGWKVMAYVKNLEDKDSITGTFLNSDDSGLTTNVFLNEPRLYGVRATKAWSGPSFGRRTERSAPTGPARLAISGGVSRLSIDAENETFTPFWASIWNPVEFPLPLGVQNDDLDTGDGREVSITYRPQGGPWTVTGGVRFGRANGSSLISHTEASPQIPWFTQAQVDAYGLPQKYSSPEFPSFVSNRADNREEHTLVDFQIGRDFGMGALGQGGTSTLALGLRYAQFKSSTDVIMDGQPYRTDPDTVFGPPHVADVVEADFDSRREFEGWGPTASWAAAKHLLGDRDTGYVLLDWSLSGGILFGKQRTTADYEAASRNYEWPAYGLSSSYPSLGNPQSETLDSGSSMRSDDVTVPVAGVSLGLSYQIDRFKVSTGYHYETYFDVLDGGVGEARDVDRTIQGPYLRFTLGFGG